MTRSQFRTYVAAVLAALVCVPATAYGFQDRPWRGFQVVQASLLDCGADVARVCPDVVPGGGRILQCLERRRDRLSPACRARIERGRSVRSTFFACNQDAARFCGDLRPGGGRIVRCLIENEDRISPDCATALDDLRSLSR